MTVVYVGDYKIGDHVLWTGISIIIAIIIVVAVIVQSLPG